MTSRDAIKMIEKDEWYEVRQKGSHKHFKHDEKPGLVTVPVHSNKELAIGTLRSIMKQAGLDKDLRK